MKEENDGKNERPMCLPCQILFPQMLLRMAECSRSIVLSHSIMVAGIVYHNFFLESNTIRRPDGAKIRDGPRDHHISLPEKQLGNF